MPNISINHTHMIKACHTQELGTSEYFQTVLELAQRVRHVQVVLLG